MMLEPDLESFIRSVLPEGDWRLSPIVRSHNLVVRAVAGTRDLVVRIQPTRRMSEPAALALIAFLGALSTDPDLRVPSPVRLAAGRWFATCTDGGTKARCTLVTWVPGERAPDASSFVEADRLRSLGAAVARMHRVSSGIPPGVGDGIPHLGADSLLGETFCLDGTGLEADLGPALNDRLRGARGTMESVLRRMESDPGQVGLIHADLEPQNWVFLDDRPGAIDFDETRRGPFALDLVGVLWTHAMWDDYPSFREELFAGYESVRPLPTGTREDADALMSVSFLVWLDFIYRQLGDEDRARHLQYVRPMAERIVEWCAAG